LLCASLQRYHANETRQSRKPATLTSGTSQFCKSQMNHKGSTTSRLLGRPRDERADRAILRATLELIAKHGVPALRMDDVADRAGVGKATIYRRHRSKEELVTAAIAALVSEIEVPDTGSTRGDLLALMQNAVGVYRASVEAAVMPSLVDAMSRDAALARTVREGFLAGRRAALGAVLERGVGRGDLRVDLDLELALDVLGGPLFYRLLVTGGPIDRQLADGVVELILRGFAPAQPSRRKPSTPKREVAS
jgi:AcrR family transcriptional regulator